MRVKIKSKIAKHKKITDEEIIDLLLKNRTIKDKQEFLNPKHPEKIFFEEVLSKKEFAKVIKKLKEIREKEEMIVVYTDYDADGITGGAILWETLYLLGFKAMPYVPHRQFEGYGFSKKGIDAVKKLYNPSLIISVDHGISAAEKISYAKSLGIPVVITDHHIKTAKKPNDALAIFHTDKLSGVGVAYFFAKEIFISLRGSASWRRPSNAANEIVTPRFSSRLAMTTLEENFSADYLSLASIGTIADLVPLLGPSRSLVKYGLEAFPKLRRIGLKYILKEAGIEDRKITPYEIGFIIAPRINALGRLEHAIDALRLLCTKKDDRAQMLAAKISDKNRERQDLLEKAVEEAKEKFKVQSSKFKVLPKMIILSSDKWHEGIIGLIASKIAEEYYRPTIVITKADGVYKGSARSIPSFHITNFLRRLKKYLIDIGGHQGAAGFTIEEEKLNAFCTIAQQTSNKVIRDKDLERVIRADLKIPISKISLSLVKALEKLQPFGIGNPQPSFYSQGEIIDAKMFGKKTEHLKIYVKDKDSFPLELVSFNGAEQFTSLSRGKTIDLIYTLEIDRWGGNEKLRGKIINIEKV